MSFFTNIRADRFITELKEATDVAAPQTQKAIAKLRELGPGAIEPVTAALADADKIATVAYIEVLTGLVNQKPCCALPCRRKASRTPPCWT